MMWWKVFFDYVEKGFSYVSLDIFAARRVKPDNVSCFSCGSDGLR